MSRRYRQSSRHSGQYLTDLDDKIKHWQREWTSPLLNSAAAAAPAAAVTNGSASKQNTPAPGSESPPPSATAEVTSKKLYSFSVKMWVQVDEEGAVEDGDADDILDITTSTQRARDVEEDKSKSEGGLTAADIRGAVGGEAIPGIVSSQYDSQKKEEAPKDAPKEAKDEDKPVEAESKPVEVPEETQEKPDDKPEDKPEDKAEEKSEEQKPEESADKMDVDKPKEDGDVSMENA